MHGPRLESVKIKTLDRSSPDFENYLLGTFSDEYRAIPMQTLNPLTSAERITFQIVPVSSIARPSYLHVWARALRLSSLSFTLLPLTICYLWFFTLGAIIDHTLAMSSALSVFLLQSAGWLYNDYEDHLHGLDRLHSSGGSRVIQQGWLTAIQVQRVALLLLGFAIVFAVPALIAKPYFVSTMGALSLTILYLYSKANARVRSSGFSELAVFLFLGPLLTFGFTYLVIGQYLSGTWLRSISLGFLFGAMSSFVVFVRHFERIMTDGLQHVRTLPGRLGFDRSQAAILFYLAGMGFIYIYVLWLFALPAWSYVVLLTSGAGAAQIFFRIWKAKSPLSSNLQNLRFLSEFWHWLWLISLAMVILGA